MTGIAITSVFQPVVDLLSGAPLGYEVLSRGESWGGSAEGMFFRAKETGTLWELESDCRQAALRRISELQRAGRHALFFLNVSPAVAEDPRFTEDFSVADLRRRSIDPGTIVLEVTEKHPISDHDRFERIVRSLTSQGLQFAIDDFGSGHSSLLALVTCAPRFIKLDAAVVRDIHIHPYRRHLVRSLNAFAASVDARLVAEGVEQWEELDALMRLGVRYAQGFLLGRPETEPLGVSEAHTARIRETLRAADGTFGEPDEFIGSLLEPVETLPVGTVMVEDLHTRFRDNPGLDFVVLVDEGRPRGLVTRDDLAKKLAGRYAYALRQKKLAERVAKAHALVVSSDSRVTTLAAHAMERAPADLYDPVIVVDADGILVGTVTIKSLMRRSVDLQVQSAQGANPLTGLPGNRAIQRWVELGRGSADLVVVYADLDRFKEYNDCYGFLMGDEMIRLASRVLACLVSSSASARLGHVGGDDFVAVFPEGIDLDQVERACGDFDQGKVSLLDAADLSRGHMVTKNRRGVVEDVPIVTLSIAVIRRSQLPGELHSALLSHVAAALKSAAKKKTNEARRSAFVVERRVHAIGS